jgi:hypothetical protein
MALNRENDPQPTNRVSPQRWISEELESELAETAATLVRLGVTLVEAPISMMPRAQRERFRRWTGELESIAAIIPRAVTATLEELAAGGQDEPQREDLGARLRRERRKQLKEERRTARASDTPDGETAGDETAPLPDEEQAGVKIEEDIQESWNEPPLEDGEKA